MRKIIAPLALLASITLLTSCTKKEEIPVVTPAKTEMPVPVTQDGPVNTGSQATSPEASVRTRTETVTYASPADPKDPVEFSVTVTDDVITAATATPKSTNDISNKLQTAFATEIAMKAIGKKAKDLDLDTVAGASLTTAAFEQFVRSF